MTQDPFSSNSGASTSRTSNPVSTSGVEPMSPKAYSQGLMYRAMIGAVILVIGVLPLVMAGRDGIWSWFDEPLFSDFTRAIAWLILMALIEGAVMVIYVLRSAPRVRDWHQQNGSTGPAR